MAKRLMLLDADSLLYKAGFGGDKNIRTLYISGKKVGVYDKMEAVRARCKEAGLMAKDPAVEVTTVEKLANEQTVLEIADKQMGKILQEFRAWEVEGYYLGKSVYREELWPLYKASRADRKKPLHWEALVYHLGKNYPIYEIEGVEADDQISIRATEEQANGKRVVVSTIDKDLRQIPGEHFNYGWLFEGNLPWFEVTEEEAWTQFHTQILTGDSSDDIPGIKGVGPAKAKRVLEGIEDIAEQEAAVFSSYIEHYGNPEHAWEAMELNAQLLWMWRKMDDRWQPLNEELAAWAH